MDLDTILALLAGLLIGLNLTSIWRNIAAVVQPVTQKPPQQNYYHNIDDYTDIAGEIPMMSADWDEMTDYIVH